MYAKKPCYCSASPKWTMDGGHIMCLELNHIFCDRLQKQRKYGSRMDCDVVIDTVVVTHWALKVPRKVGACSMTCAWRMTIYPRTTLPPMERWSYQSSNHVTMWWIAPKRGAAAVRRFDAAPGLQAGLAGGHHHTRAGNGVHKHAGCLQAGHEGVDLGLCDSLRAAHLHRTHTPCEPWGREM
jgi:hypothetical protein